MSNMKTGYTVMCYPRNCDVETAYTGTIYEDREEARKEWFRAKDDINVDCAWVETVLCPDHDDD